MLKLPVFLFAGRDVQRRQLLVELDPEEKYKAKSLLPFLGKPLVQWVIDILEESEFVDKIYLLGIPHFAPRVRGRIKKSAYILEHQPLYNNFTWKNYIKKDLKLIKIHAGVYLKNFSEIKKFNYQGTDWPTAIQIRKKFPILSIPFEFFVRFVRVLKSGGYKEGYMGWLIALMRGAYHSLVNYYIFKLKKSGSLHK